MKGTTKHISFIIPTYNRAHTLSFSIESVLNQTNPNWELIIVDDGSTDSTSTIMEKYLADARVKYVHQKNRGVSSARNTGTEVSTGDYLIFLDSDDFIFPNLVLNLFKARFWEYDLICWQVLKRIDQKFSLWKSVNNGRMYNNVKATFLAGSICYRKSVFFEAGGYDPYMTSGENYELGLRICQIKDLRIKYLQEPLMKYMIETQDRIKNTLSDRLRSQIRLYKKHKEKYDRNPADKALIKYLIGFAFENLNRKSAAINLYKSSWRSAPWRLKPLLKYFYLKFFL